MWVPAANATNTTTPTTAADLIGSDYTNVSAEFNFTLRFIFFFWVYFACCPIIFWASPKGYASVFVIY